MPKRLRRKTREERNLIVHQVGNAVALCVYSFALVGICSCVWHESSRPKVQELEPIEQEEQVEVAQQMPEVKVVEKEAQPASVMTKWADCRITAYCPCEKCCGKWARNRPKDENGKPIVNGASGERLHAYTSCASSLPFGTELYIPDLDLYTTVQDRASKSIDAKYGGKYVDIYIDEHEECYEYLAGKPDYMEVYIYEQS